MDGKLSPETLAEYNPDYAQFQNLTHVHPLLWSKPEALTGLSGQAVTVIAFLGPAASGKDTILRAVDTRVPFSWIKTATTRPKRDHDPMEKAYTFLNRETFDDIEMHHDFIETIPQAAGLYGTPKQEVIRAVEGGHRLIVWRGEEIGLKKLWDWLAERYPDVTRRVAVTIPAMPMRDFVGRIIQKRGLSQALGGRIQKAKDELINAGTIADFLIFNPPEVGGPHQATDATETLFRMLLNPEDLRK